MTSIKSETQKLDMAKARAAITQAYKTGYQEGLCERQKFLNTLKITNNHLWSELCRLDQDEPELGIRISVDFAERLAASLQKRHSGQAKLLRRKIRESNHRFDKLLSILDHCRDYK